MVFFHCFFSSALKTHRSGHYNQAKQFGNFWGQPQQQGPDGLSEVYTQLNSIKMKGLMAIK